MANNLITSSKIVNETLEVIHNNSAFLGNVNVEYKDEFAQSGAKAGATVNLRRPVQYQIRNGAAINIQDVNETTVPFTVQPEIGVDWAFSDYDLTLSLDKFSKRYLQPAGKRLATEIDMKIAALYKSVANFSGTPGTTPATAASMLTAAVKLDNAAAPRDDMRICAISPTTNAALVGGLSGLFAPQKEVGDQLKKGLMSTNLGMDFQMSQNVPTHTVGGLGGTPLVNGANQGTINSGSTDNPYASTTSLVTDAWSLAAANRLKAGDVINIAGVFAVNLENKQPTGLLQDFVVTADVASDASGNATLVISPAIIAGGAYQNVTARPADNAAITVKTGTASTTYEQNLLFHKDAFTFATVDMELPGGMDMASRAEFGGISLRFVRGYDITNNRRICRFDILYAAAAMRPEWAVRVTG